MKSTHNKSTQPVVKYPCLMVGEQGQVVLFENYGCGTVVVSTVEYQPIGNYSITWAMDCFTPLPPNESVTLKND